VFFFLPAPRCYCSFQDIKNCMWQWNDPSDKFSTKFRTKSFNSLYISSWWQDTGGHSDTHIQNSVFISLLPFVLRKKSQLSLQSHLLNFPNSERSCQALCGWKITSRVPVRNASIKLHPHSTTHIKHLLTHSLWSGIAQSV
jgi:hypothetical protein